MRGRAAAAAEAGREGQTPDADETLLGVLAEMVREGLAPTPGEILARARQLDPGVFARRQAPWRPRAVSERLKNYGVPPPRKSHGERRYRDLTPDALGRIRRRCGIDPGTPSPAALARGAALPGGAPT